MRRARLLALAAAALATTVAAQEQPGVAPTHGGTVPRYVAAQMVGGCVVRSHPKAAMAFVAAGPAADDDGASASDAAIRNLKYALEPCLAGRFSSVTLAPIELRGVLAEALLKAGDAALLTRARAMPSRPPARIAMPKPGAPNIALFTCAAAAAPGTAAALLDAAPASTAEAAAFQLLVPSVQACAPANAELHVRPNNVRWLLATALYRLVQRSSGT